LCFADDVFENVIEKPHRVNVDFSQINVIGTAREDGHKLAFLWDMSWNKGKPISGSIDWSKSVLPDFFGMAFWHFTRWEETYANTKVDLHGRHLAKDSVAWKAQLLKRPVVDEWVTWLREVLNDISPGSCDRIVKASYNLSHDVDVPFIFLSGGVKKLAWTCGGDILKRKSILRPFKTIFACLAVKKGNLHADPMYTFDYIMDLSERYDKQSTFYFICGNSGGAIDGDYDVRSKPITDLIKHIINRGHKIGLHPSFGSCNDFEILSKEYNVLKKLLISLGYPGKAFGSRQHLLRFKLWKTAEMLNELGVCYDQSIGYPDSIGYRCGTSVPFKFFDLRRDVETGLWLRPLILMDVTLFNKKYMGLNSLRSVNSEIELLKHQTEKHGGELSILWHNNQLDNPFKKSCYENAIKLLHSLGN
jgi:hypothetical protein